jgi:hypothetical protein
VVNPKYLLPSSQNLVVEEKETPARPVVTKDPPPLPPPPPPPQPPPQPPAVPKLTVNQRQIDSVVDEKKYLHPKRRFISQFILNEERLRNEREQKESAATAGAGAAEEMSIKQEVFSNNGSSLNLILRRNKKEADLKASLALNKSLARKILEKNLSDITKMRSLKRISSMNQLRFVDKSPKVNHMILKISNN